MPQTSRVLSEVFDSLCRAPAAEVLGFNALGLADATGAMATPSRGLPEVLDSLRWAATAKVQHCNEAEITNMLRALVMMSGVPPMAFNTLRQGSGNEGAGL